MSTKTYSFGPSILAEDLSKSDPGYSCALTPTFEPVTVYLMVDGDEFSVLYDGGKTAIFGDRDSAVLFVSAYQGAIGRPVRLLENFSA